MGSLSITEVWVPQPANPTRVYNPSIGVTPRKAVQVTNNTAGELWLDDSGTVPASPEQAKYIVPPRCTANYPLGSENIAVRWNSLISTTGDLITFVFTDDDVVPTVQPGVSGLGGLASPVQTRIYSQSRSLAPLAITTLSGKNVGSLYVYNQTCLAGECNIPLTGSIIIPPYSWACLPLNVKSLTFQFPNIVAADDFFPSDCCYLAWSDVDYVAPFPVGAGMLPDPTQSPMPTMSGAFPQNFPGPSVYPTGEFSLYQELLVAGGVSLFGILPAEAIFIKTVSVEVWGAGAATSYVQASNGLNGTSGTPTVLARTRVAGAGVLGSVTREVGLVVRNRNAGGLTRTIDLIGSGAVNQATATISGWRMF